MNTLKLITLITLILFSDVSFGKKVCIVKNKKDADVCLNITQNRALADYVIIRSYQPHKTGTNVWIITDKHNADIKIYFSEEPGLKKVFFSENNEDGHKHTKHK